MAFYLVDEHIKNISLDIEKLELLSNLFFDRREQLAPVLYNPEDDIWIVYTIRFDQKGYKVFSFKEFCGFFEQANNIERIIITLETTSSLNSGRTRGEYVELRLDTKDNNGCFLVSSSNNKDWCESSFNSINSLLSRYRAPYSIIRNDLTPLIIQLFGVVLIYAFCILFAYQVYKVINIENPFFISFFFMFLILSNLWTYLNNYILNIFNKVFPNVEIKRVKKYRIHWILQAILGTSIFTLMIFVLEKIFSYVFNLIQILIK